MSYFLEPIIPILVNNVYSAINNKKDKYSAYITLNKDITRTEVEKQVKNYIIVDLQIRKNKKKQSDYRDWWNEKDGDKFIQQTISRNWFQTINIAMFDMDSDEAATTCAEQILEFIKTYTQACFNLPKFVTIDECMTLAKIHDLISYIFYFIFV